MSATSTWPLEMTAKLDEPASPWAALLAAILFGVSTPLAKGLLQGVSPQVLAGLFYMGSGVGLASLTHLPRRGAAPKGGISHEEGRSVAFWGSSVRWSSCSGPSAYWPAADSRFKCVFASEFGERLHSGIGVDCIS